MSKYYLSSQENNQLVPFQLEPNIGVDCITELLMEECYVQLGHKITEPIVCNSFYNTNENSSYFTSLQSVSGGYLTNYYCIKTFKNCNELTLFKSDISNAVNCEEMFYGCSSLVTFIADVSNLSNATNMFYGCNNLENVTFLNATEEFYDKVTNGQIDLGIDIQKIEWKSVQSTDYNCYIYIYTIDKDIDTLLNDNEGVNTKYISETINGTEYGYSFGYKLTKENLLDNTFGVFYETEFGFLSTRNISFKLPYISGDVISYNELKTMDLDDTQIDFYNSHPKTYQLHKMLCNLSEIFDFAHDNSIMNTTFNKRVLEDVEDVNDYGVFVERTYHYTKFDIDQVNTILTRDEEKKCYIRIVFKDDIIMK